MEDIEKFCENLKNMSTSELIKIQEDYFVFKYNKNYISEENKESAAIAKKDHCRTCNIRMDFKVFHYYTSCPSGVNGCTSKTLYECNQCARGYCTYCAFPPNIEYCHCGVLLTIDSSPSHNCDLCGTRLTNTYRRCSTHDYDVCDNCYNSKKINKN
jgi:hypothetical protein